MSQDTNVTEELSKIRTSLEQVNEKVDRLSADTATARAQNVYYVTPQGPATNGGSTVVEPVLADNTELDDYETDFSKDENSQRGNWSGRLDFLLSCLGYAVGLGNVWRFPYLCYKNGGGAFFIPYCIMLFFVGIPIFFLELSLGQFSSSGPLTCWKFAPAFTGIGVAMVIVSALVSIYYNMIIAWSIYYLCASFTSDLPWNHCPEDRSSPMCLLRMPDMHVDNCTSSVNVTLFRNMTDGVCYDTKKKAMVGVFNSTAFTAMGYKRSTPAENYLEYVALGTAYSPGIHNIGGIRWDLSLCLLAAWFIIFLSLIKGIKSSGKVVYFTALFPYVVLIVLLVRGALLDGHLDGIRWYLYPDFNRLLTADVWKDAAVQIFFSLSASWGGLIALSSYNRFHNDCFRDTMIVCFGNCLTSFFAGFVIFSYVGYLAKQLGVKIEDVAKSGVTLAFAIYPEAVKRLPVPTLWSILFFLMLITLGLDSQFAMVETVLTSFEDICKYVRRHKSWFLLLYCFVFYLIGLCMCTNGGPYILQILDDYTGGWNLLVVSITECIAVGWVYGFPRFKRDIGTMLGRNFCCCCPWSPLGWYWSVFWCALTPLLVAAVMVFSWVRYSPSSYGTYQLPMWANGIGWAMTASVLLGLFVTFFGMIIYYSLRGSPLDAFRPTKEWGPALVKHRRLITYVPGFVVDPNEDQAPVLGEKPADPNWHYENPGFVADDGNKV